LGCDVRWAVVVSEQV